MDKEFILKTTLKTRLFASISSFFSQGVTLLEIMLVLAIAAMIIVMSVRYYQSATAAQQANSTLEQIQAIVAAADSLAQSNGSYSGTSKTVADLLPTPPGLKTAWGSAITLDGSGKTSLKITLATVPKNVCPLITTKLAANSRYTIGACTAADLVITYGAG